MINITREELIRYLYNETSEPKSAAIKAALQTDYHLLEAFQKLEEAINNLTEINCSPSEKTIGKILEYGTKKQGHGDQSLNSEFTV